MHAKSLLKMAWKQNWLLLRHHLQKELGNNLDVEKRYNELSFLIEFISYVRKQSINFMHVTHIFILNTYFGILKRKLLGKDALTNLINVKMRRNFLRLFCIVPLNTELNAKEIVDAMRVYDEMMSHFTPHG